VNLSSCPSYGALSHSWDKQTPQVPIWCNSHKLLVTENVHAAMCQLRSRGRPRTLWIDQVCINQADLQERHRQVCLMGEVYTSAQRVVVWLGSADAATEGAWELLEGFCRLTFSDDHQLKLCAHHISAGSVAEDLSAAPAVKDDSVRTQESSPALPLKCWTSPR
jgi:hypothetical protein